MKLKQYVDTLRTSRAGGHVVELELSDDAPPGLLERLAKLDRLGLLNGDALMSIVAQAPIDPLNLFAALRAASPATWVFSAIDFGAMRILSRDDQGCVSAALRIDLMDSSVTTLAVNGVGQLTPHKRYEPDGKGPAMLDRIQAMCDEAITAAARERSATRRTP